MSSTPMGLNGEGMSLYGWGESLKSAPGLIDEFAREFETLASQADDEQPADQRISERIHEVVRLLRQAQSVAEELHPTFRTYNEADIERTENPRKGSLLIERKADVSVAMRDM